MVHHPGEYRWSSFSHHIGTVSNKMIRDHEIFLRLGIDNSDRAEAYLALFELEINNIYINTIRESTNNGWVLGDEKFKEEISKYLNRRISPTLRGGDRKSVEFQKRKNI